MKVTLMCDASYCSDHKVAGYGFWVAGKRGKLSGGGSIQSIRVQNSTTAEMMAVANALSAALIAGVVTDNDSVLVQTDCLAAIDAFQARRHNLNEQELEAVYYVNETAYVRNIALIFRHVKAHTGILDKRSIANHMCDRRAKKGMRSARALAIQKVQNDLHSQSS